MPTTGDRANPALAMQRGETVSAVREAIARLPHDIRSVFLLHHYEHLSYQEIAGIAGCSERGVETRLYRARQRLRQSLAPLWDGTPVKPGEGRRDSP